MELENVYSGHPPFTFEPYSTQADPFLTASLEWVIVHGRSYYLVPVESVVTFGNNTEDLLLCSPLDESISVYMNHVGLTMSSGFTDGMVVGMRDDSATEFMPLSHNPHSTPLQVPMAQTPLDPQLLSSHADLPHHASVDCINIEVSIAAMQAKSIAAITNPDTLKGNRMYQPNCHAATKIDTTETDTTESDTTESDTTESDTTETGTTETTHQTSSTTTDYKLLCQGSIKRCPIFNCPRSIKPFNRRDNLYNHVRGVHGLGISKRRLARR